MKTLVLVALLAAGCFVDRRSPGFACESQRDCDHGRVCEQGFCVADGSGGGNCPDICASCGSSNGAPTCNIHCNAQGDCNDVVCPAGMACTIECSDTNACPAIDCRAAAACDITCSDRGACPGGIACGDGACSVDCRATDACGPIDCSHACQCDVACAQNGNACAATACPGDPGRCTGGADMPCDSSASGCNTCGP